MIETLPKLRQESLKQESRGGDIVEHDDNYNPTKAEEDTNYLRDLYGMIS